MREAYRHSSGYSRPSPAAALPLAPRLLDSLKPVHKASVCREIVEATLGCIEQYLRGSAAVSAVSYATLAGQQQAAAAAAAEAEFDKSALKTLDLGSSGSVEALCDPGGMGGVSGESTPAPTPTGGDPKRLSVGHASRLGPGSGSSLWGSPSPHPPAGSSTASAASGLSTPGGRGGSSSISTVASSSATSTSSSMEDPHTPASEQLRRVPSGASLSASAKGAAAATPLSPAACDAAQEALLRTSHALGVPLGIAVFDVDDTLVRASDGQPLGPVVELVVALASRRISVHLITGRLDDAAGMLYASTVEQLNAVGLRQGLHWDTLTLAPPSARTTMSLLSQWKRQQRARIVMQVREAAASKMDRLVMLGSGAGKGGGQQAGAGAGAAGGAGAAAAAAARSTASASASPASTSTLFPSAPSSPAMPYGIALPQPALLLSVGDQWGDLLPLSTDMDICALDAALHGVSAHPTGPLTPHGTDSSSSSSSHSTHHGGSPFASPAATAAAAAAAHSPYSQAQHPHGGGGGGRSLHLASSHSGVARALFGAGLGSSSSSSSTMGNRLGAWGGHAASAAAPLKKFAIVPLRDAHCAVALAVSKGLGAMSDEGAAAQAAVIAAVAGAAGLPGAGASAGASGSASASASPATPLTSGISSLRIRPSHYHTPAAAASAGSSSAAAAAAVTYTCSPASPGSAVSAYISAGEASAGLYRASGGIVGCSGAWAVGAGAHVGGFGGVPAASIIMSPEVSSAVGGGLSGLFAHVSHGNPDSDVEHGRPLWGLKLPVSEPGS